MGRFLTILIVVCSITSLGSSSRAANRLRGFPAQLEGTVDVASPLAVDLDADGRLEILAASRDKIHGLEIDGSPVEGYPIVLGQKQSIQTGLTLGSFREDGPTLLSFGTSDGSLHLLGLNGQTQPAFPVKLGAKAVGAPLFATLGEKTVLLLALEDGRVVSVGEDGKPQAGFSVRIQGRFATAPTWAPMAPGEDSVLIIGDDKGKLYAFSRDGSLLSGFPYRAKYALVGQPVLGDLDDDGRYEIVVGSKDFGIHAVESDGKACPGFPVATGYRIYSSCALADMDADGVVEIVATSGDGKLYVLNGRGKPLKGFPVKVDRRLRGAPVVGDLDADGRLEIALGTERKGLCVFRSDGRRYPGYPVRFSDRMDVSPLLADLNGDGLGEVIGISRDGRLAAYRMLRKGKKSRGLVWPSAGGSPGRTARPSAHPARYVELSLSPAEPSTVDDLSLGYRFFDMDGEAEPETLLRWYRNGRRVKEFDGARSLPADKTRKHERWRFGLRAGPKLREFKSNEVRVLNTPPAAPIIRLVPDDARTRDELRVEFEQPAADPDGDRIRYRYAWLKDRRLQNRLRKDRVSASRTRKGQRWTVVVTPFDGEVKGAVARRSITIGNTAPGTPSVKLKPAKPRVTQELAIQVVKEARDADGDKLSYRYDWFRDGEALNVSRLTSRLPAAFARKQGKLAVEVRAFDGLEEGEAVRAEAVLINSPPQAPRVDLLPSKPGTADDLRVRILSAATDADGDALRYRYRWKKNGKWMTGAGFEGARLAADKTRKGEVWTAFVRARDDEAEGAEGQAERRVVNSPPVPPRLALPSHRLSTLDPLTLKVEAPPRDPDGDPVWCEVRWTSQGRTLAEGRDLFEIPADKTRKSQVYEAQVVATDGELRAKPVRLSFQVQNSPPGPCSLRLEPEQAKTGRALKAVLKAEVQDKDGDALRMRYQWLLDGRLLPKQKAASLPGKVLRRGMRVQVFARADDGEDLGPECHAETTVGNLPPSPPVIRLQPAAPKAGESLRLVFDSKGKDPDGDLLRLELVWSLDGREFASGASVQELAPGLLRKGQRWQVKAWTDDGELKSRLATASAQVVNSAPGKPSVAINPAKPLSSEDLHCRLLKPSPDPDGDALSHHFTWHLGKEDRIRHQGARLPASSTRKGQRWSCRVKADDGQLQGPESRAKVRVANARPAAPRVELSPREPKDGDELRCRILEEAADPDGDRVRYRFRWLKDGVEQRFAPQTDRVPARLTKSDDIWQCMVVASDGGLDGPVAESRETLIRR